METELPIWLCLKSRSERISENFSSDMPSADSESASLRETACSRCTMSSSHFLVFSSSTAFWPSKVSMSSLISLSRAKSSLYFCVRGSSASFMSDASCASCFLPERMNSCASVSRR